jgi:hypothetical protein
MFAAVGGHYCRQRVGSDWKPEGIEETIQRTRVGIQAGKPMEGVRFQGFECEENLADETGETVSAAGEYRTNRVCK